MLGNLFQRTKDCKKRINKGGKTIPARINTKTTLNSEVLSQAETKIIA